MTMLLQCRRWWPTLAFIVFVLLIALWVYHRWNGPPENPLNLTKGETVIFGVVMIFWFLGCFMGFAYGVERYIRGDK